MDSDQIPWSPEILQKELVALLFNEKVYLCAASDVA
jgi:hypothetical protein